MVDAVHRLAKNLTMSNSPRGIILKFCRRVDMEEMRRWSKFKRYISASELGYMSCICQHVSLQRHQTVVGRDETIQGTAQLHVCLDNSRRQNLSEQREDGARILI